MRPTVYSGDVIRNPFTTARRLPFLILPLLLGSATVLGARPWSFIGIPQPMEAEFIGMKNGGVVLQGPNGKNFEVPVTSFPPADQQYLKLLEKGGGQTSALELPGKPITSRAGYHTKSVDTLTNQVVTLAAATELHVTGTGDPIAGCGSARRTRTPNSNRRRSRRW